MAGEWTLIGTTTLGSAGDTISVSGLDARNFLYIEIQLIEDGNLDSYITFNSDTSGGNYSLRYSDILKLGYSTFIEISMFPCQISAPLKPLFGLSIFQIGQVDPPNKFHLVSKCLDLYLV